MNSKDIDSFSKRNDDECAKHKQVDCGDKSKFKCACGVVYDHRGSLNNHIRYKTISYTCPHCSKVFVSSFNFKNHLNNQGCSRDGDDDDDDDDDDDNVEEDDDDNVEKDDEDNDDRNKHSGSSRRSPSRPPPPPSNAKGIVIIISL